LQNLVSNAIKYTPEGRVLIGCRRKKGKVRIEVHDTGLGIPLSQQKTIFREFKRLDEGARIARGLGLGLSIVERIARLLRHPLKLSSVPGKGSLFSVELPLTEQAPHTRLKAVDTPTPMMPLSGMEILVIDNEPAIVNGMRILLEGWGCRVNAFSSLAELGGITVPLDAIIADYHLDTGTGLDAIRTLRDQIRPELPAILITADRTQAVREVAEAEGVVVLHKPRKPAALRALLAQWRAARL
jgi:CheY-like chemotaxis protein